jgi:hypothetical protein
MTGINFYGIFFAMHLNQNIKDIEDQISGLRRKLINIISDINKTLFSNVTAAKSDTYKNLKADYLNTKNELNSLRSVKKNISGGDNQITKPSSQV